MTVAPGLDHGPELVPVNQLSNGRSTVADELRDLLDRDASVGEHRDERVPQLARTARG